VRFGDTVVNSGLSDSLFTFVPPPGVAVVQH
jgi:outer membrane lipoprotein-sorting protein